MLAQIAGRLSTFRVGTDATRDAPAFFDRDVFALAFGYAVALAFRNVGAYLAWNFATFGLERSLWIRLRRLANAALDLALDGLADFLGDDRAFSLRSRATNAVRLRLADFSSNGSARLFGLDRTFTRGFVGSERRLFAYLTFDGLANFSGNLRTLLLGYDGAFTARNLDHHVLADLFSRSDGLLTLLDRHFLTNALRHVATRVERNVDLFRLAILARNVSAYLFGDVATSAGGFRRRFGANVSRNFSRFNAAFLSVDGSAFLARILFAASFLRDDGAFDVELTRRNDFANFAFDRTAIGGTGFGFTTLALDDLSRNGAFDIAALLLRNFVAYDFRHLHLLDGAELSRYSLAVFRGNVGTFFLLNDATFALWRDILACLRRNRGANL